MHRRRFFYLDYESIKRYGLDHLNVDLSKTYEVFNPSNYNHTIHLYLNKDLGITCPRCNGTNIKNVGTKNIKIKYASALEDNIDIIWHRRQYICYDCEKPAYFQEPSPFNTPNFNVSIQKEMKMLFEFKSETATYSSIAKKYHVSPTYVMYLFDKKVNIIRNKLTTVVCFDEVYSRKLSKYSYCFVIYSPQQKRILDILDSRRLNDLGDYFRKIPKEEKNAVTYISIDLYETYRIVAKRYFPNAKISADSFHVIKNLTECFQKIRIRIMNHYIFLKGENHYLYWLLKKYWKFLLIDTSKLSYNTIKTSKTGQYLNPRQIISYMLDISPELKLAYELKEEYRVFNSTATIDNAEKWLDELIIKFKSSNIKEYIPFWKLLQNWHNEIINSFNRINGYRISNGPIERVNRTIKSIIEIGFGSTNFVRMRNRIMYCVNDNASVLYEKKQTNKTVGKSRGKYTKNK